MTKYPDDFPLDNIREIVNIVRSGDIKSQSSVLAYNVWVVQGYGQKMLIGNPDEPISLARVQKVPDADALTILEKVLSDEPAPQASLPWDFLLSYLFDLLKELLENMQES